MSPMVEYRYICTGKINENRDFCFYRAERYGVTLIEE